LCAVRDEERFQKLRRPLMKPKPFVRVCVTVWIAVATIAVSTKVPARVNDPNLTAFEDATGQVRTFNVNGSFDLNNPFFQDLGTNGRRCVSCHQPADGWTITPENVQARFLETNG